MPWTCTACTREEIGDTLACPGCGNKKTAWTVNEGQTRLFKVTRTRTKFAVFVGDGTEPGPADAPEQTAHAETPAKSAWSLPRATALDLARRGLRPAPAHQLTVRVWCKANADLKVHSEILFAAAQPAEQEIATEPASGPETDVRCVFVHGPGDPVSFEGLHVIDVSEDGGHAASVKLSALGKKARELSLQPVPVSVEKARLHGWVRYDRTYLAHGNEGDVDPLVIHHGLSRVDVKVVRPEGLDLPSQLTAKRGGFDFGELPHGDYILEVSVYDQQTYFKRTLPLPPSEDGTELHLRELPPTSMAENLSAAHQVLPLVNAKIHHYNKNDEGLLDKIAKIGGIIELNLKAKFSTIDDTIEHDDDEIPPGIHAPGPAYIRLRKLARISRQAGVGNCGEKAAYAAILLSGRGLHPVEAFHLKDGDHSFCVVGRDPDSPIDTPTAWGANAVVCDPWQVSAYPAKEAVEYLQEFKNSGETRPCPRTQIVGVAVF